MRHDDGFSYFSERFADLQVLRYRIPHFEDLAMNQKRLLYCLSRAALCGRDIFQDQNYRYNLLIRHTLEALIHHYPGDRRDASFEALLVYAKRFWFSNGIHHHYSYSKFIPDMDPQAFQTMVRACDPTVLPLAEDQNLEQFLEELTPILFDPRIDNRMVSKDSDVDRVAHSAVNYYQDVSEQDVEAFYKARKDPEDRQPVSHGLNSRLIRQDGVIREQVYKVGGLYSKALAPMVAWLEKALPHAESEQQRAILEKLIAYYRTGNLRDFDDYCVAWVGENSSIDMIHGFIESYNDPLGYRGSYGAVVSIQDPVATRRIRTIADTAQWFEDHSPIMDDHKKKEVRGVAGSVINVVMEAGDCSPATPIGVNLPNADWIREVHGSKSVNLANIVTAYNKSSGRLQEEFIYSDEELERYREHGPLSDDLHTDLHEVIGHGSGRLEDGIATPRETLKHYASTMEETRADLVALYYILDPKLVELGLMPSPETGYAQCDGFIRNGLMVQLRRVKPDENLEEDHMRNRQLIAAWAMELGAENKVIEKKVKDGKSYFVINDYQRLRAIFGQQLKEVQRIKSQGDFQAAEMLVEQYGVKVDGDIHREVSSRFAKLNLAPYSGFINPHLEAVEENGEIIDVRVSYPEDFAEQMLEYSRQYGFLDPRETL